jgi:CelD/BcsL family acetyltransferase involved in cellulose biosynthesis
MVLWRAISWACEQGYARFDFGRTDRDAAGLLDFKRGWGTRETDLAYWTTAREDGGGAGLLRPSITAPLSRLGAEIIRRSPPIVGQLVGQALYRYSG